MTTDQVARELKMPIRTVRAWARIIGLAGGTGRPIEWTPTAVRKLLTIKKLRKCGWTMQKLRMMLQEVQDGRGTVNVIPLPTGGKALFISVPGDDEDTPEDVVQAVRVLFEADNEEGQTVLGLSEWQEPGQHLNEK